MSDSLQRSGDDFRAFLSAITADEEGVGVVEIILILVENLTTPNPCGYC